MDSRANALRLQEHVCPSNYGDLRKKKSEQISEDVVVITSPVSDLSNLHTPSSSSSFKHKATYYRRVNKVRKALPMSSGKRK